MTIDMFNRLPVFRESRFLFFSRHRGHSACERFALPDALLVHRVGELVGQLLFWGFDTNRAFRRDGQTRSDVAVIGGQEGAVGPCRGVAQGREERVHFFARRSALLCAQQGHDLTSAPGAGGPRLLPGQLAKGDRPGRAPSAVRALRRCLCVPAPRRRAWFAAPRP